jgi:4-amino-4-deoxy-L-arabinose transferase-like glycosyltransferase
MGVIGLSVGLRIVAAFYLGHSVNPLPGIFDQISYHTLAVRVLEGHGFSFGTEWWPATAANQPTAHWSFLYVLYLAGVYGIFGPDPLAARLIQVLTVGVLQPYLTYRVSKRLFGARVGLVSALVVACYAYFVYYAAALLTESFYIVAILWSLDRAMVIASGEPKSVQRHWWLWLQLGLALATAVLLRQVVLAVVPVVLAWAWWNAAAGGEGVRPVGAGRRQTAVRAVAAAWIIVAAVLPWTIRNYAVFHRFVLLNTNAGFAFYWGNHPIHGTRFVPILPNGMYARLIPDELKALDEAAMERALMRRGLAFVSDDPTRVLRLSASRIEEYLKFWPSRESGRASNYARTLSFGVCFPFMVGGVCLALSRRRRALNAGASSDWAGSLLLVGVAGVYSLVHLLTWALVRYRLPVDAVMMPFAALALVRVHDRLLRSARIPAVKRATI